MGAGSTRSIRLHHYTDYIIVQTTHGTVKVPLGRLHSPTDSVPSIRSDSDEGSLLFNVQRFLAFIHSQRGARHAVSTAATPA